MLSPLRVSAKAATEHPSLSKLPRSLLADGRTTRNSGKVCQSFLTGRTSTTDTTVTYTAHRLSQPLHAPLGGAVIEVQGNMRLTRFKLCLLTLIVLALNAASALAQEWTPFGPSNIRYDLELFAPPDISDYANWPRPAEGMFFQYERLYWSIQQPRTSDIGVQGSPFNSDDNGFMVARQTWGNRYELGFVEDDKGWFVSVLDVQPQIQQFRSDGRTSPPLPTNTQRQNAPSGLDNAAVTFLDVNLNPFVIIFPELDATNYTSFHGVEINRTWRYKPNHSGNVYQLMLGVRWLEMDDTFNVDLPDNPGFPEWGGSFWHTAVHNNMFGPQVGLLFHRTTSRWDLYCETRFMAGPNFETVHQQSVLDLTPRTPIPPFPAPQFDFFRIPQPVLGNPTPFPISFLSSLSEEQWANDVVFAAIGELRAGVSYKLTKAISVEAGYNFILGTGISRASRRVNYGPVNGTTQIFPFVGAFTPPLPGISILDAHKREGFFTNGLSLGITFNR
jgi:hypothetical protein